MLSGLTLPEDNLDHRGEKPREGAVTEGKGALLAQKSCWIRKTKHYQLSKEELLEEICGDYQDGRALPSSNKGCKKQVEERSQKHHTSYLLLGYTIPLRAGSSLQCLATSSTVPSE